MSAWLEDTVYNPVRAAHAMQNLCSAYSSLVLRRLLRLAETDSLDQSNNFLTHDKIHAMMQHASLYLQQVWYCSFLDDNDAFASSVHLCRTDRYHSSWRNWKNITLQYVDHASQIPYCYCIAVLLLLWCCCKAIGKLTCAFCVAFVLFLHFYCVGILSL